MKLEVFYHDWTLEQHSIILDKIDAIPASQLKEMDARELHRIVCRYMTDTIDEICEHDLTTPISFLFHSDEIAYELNLWGDFFNGDYSHNIKSGLHRFDSESKYLKFIDELTQLKVEYREHKYGKPISTSDDLKQVMSIEVPMFYAVEKGTAASFTTKVFLHLIHTDKTYYLNYDFEKYVDVQHARWMFIMGNYACDCNLSLFLKSDYPDFEELECGSEIEYVDIIVHNT